MRGYAEPVSVTLCRGGFVPTKIPKTLDKNNWRELHFIDSIIPKVFVRFFHIQARAYVEWLLLPEPSIPLRSFSTNNSKGRCGFVNLLTLWGLKISRCFMSNQKSYFCQRID